MLFDLWRKTLHQKRGSAALVDVQTGGRTTFGALDHLVSLEPRVGRGSLLTACTADGMERFIVQTLRAWRDGAAFFPCESQAPDASLLRGLPAGVAHVKTTSGSTGEARFVLFGEEQLHADVINISTTMGFDPSRPNLGVISAAHSYGFSHLVLPLLIMGMPLWHAPDPLPSTMRAAFASGGPFFLPAVPAMWRAWHRAGVLAGAPVVLAMSAGAPLPLELEKSVFEAAGLKIHNFYGASECGGIAYDSTPTPRDDPAMVGAPLNGVRLTTNEDGCMVVTSKAVASGYWPPAPASAIGRGFVATSDLAEITPCGVRLIGRRSDAINVAGRKVPPAAIESVLLTCPQVAHCVVFGVPSTDPLRGEEIVACVNCAPSVGRPDLVALLASSLPSWQMPRHWWLTSAIEPDERGKISRSRWRACYLESHA